VPTLSIPLKDLDLGTEAAHTITRVKQAYTFLGPSIQLSIDAGTAHLTLPAAPPQQVADSHKTFERANRAAKTAEIADLEHQLGGADFPLEASLTRINRLGEMPRTGTRNQQKRALNLLFDKILIGLGGKIEGVKLQDWARPLFANLLMTSGDNVCPRGGVQEDCQLTLELSH